MIAMKAVDPEFEKKVLLDAMEQMQDPDATLRKQDRLRNTVYGIGTTGLFIAFFLAINSLAHILLITFIAGMASGAVGSGLFLDLVQKQWPITMKHINMDSIQARLKELDNK